MTSNTGLVLKATGKASDARAIVGRGSEARAMFTVQHGGRARSFSYQEVRACCRVGRAVLEQGSEFAVC